MLMRQSIFLAVVLMALFASVSRHAVLSGNHRVPERGPALVARVNVKFVLNVLRSTTFSVSTTIAKLLLVAPILYSIILQRWSSHVLPLFLFSLVAIVLLLLCSLFGHPRLSIVWRADPIDEIFLALLPCS